MNALIDELSWRGFIAESTDIEALSAHLDAGQVTSYVGFDPTAASLHIGHLMQLLLARRLQRAGHRPILLVGGATGLIGDPKMSGERVMNSADIVAQWAERLRAQVSQYVSLDGENAAIIANNYEWVSQMSTIDFLREVGKHFSINRMLARDVVARRLESGISYSEFSYMLLQSLDYRELYRRYGATLQTGAQDQWGNIVSGIDFIRRTDQVNVHGLVTPLLTKADGTKFGKTETGTVWIDPELTSPFAFHQFWLNAEDAKVIDYLKIFSDRSREQIDNLAEQTAAQPHLRVAQRALADDVTDIVHGVDQRKAADLAGRALFGGADLRDLDDAMMKSLADELKAAPIEMVDGQMPYVTDALAAGKVVPSKSAARRAVSEGGAWLNNVKISDPQARVREDDLLAGRFLIVRRGKKTVGAVELIR